MALNNKINNLHNINNEKYKTNVLHTNQNLTYVKETLLIT